MKTNMNSFRAITIFWTIIFLINAHTIAAKSKPYQDNGITVPLSDRVYKIWNELVLNWSDALNFCEEKNMKLLSIESAQEHELLGELLRKYDFIHKPNKSGNKFVYWTSGNNLKTLATFVWETTGNQFTYTNWLKGNPDNLGNSEHCVAIGSLEFGKWNDVKCESKLNFICEAPVTTFMRDDNLYLVWTYSKLNWWQSKNFCEDRSMKLISFENAEELAHINDFLKEQNFTFNPKSSNDYIFWTSGNDLKSEREFVWESRGVKMEFTNWEVGMPDNWRGDEHCIEMGYRGLGLWNDNRCWYKRHFICESKFEISVRSLK